MKLDILSNLYEWDTISAFEDIYSFYLKNNNCIINFLYFWNIVSQNLISEKKTKDQLDYQSSIEKSDYLLPDWIALQTFVSKKLWKKLHNINWTDFLPFFIKSLISKWEKINLFIYWSDESTLLKAENFVKKEFWLNFSFSHHWYENITPNNLKSKADWINILLIARWTPLQEMRVKNNIDYLRNERFIVFSVWWLIDFWWWKEKRAPLFMRNLKLEWFFRLINNPKKNRKKVYNSLFLFKFLLKK